MFARIIKETLTQLALSNCTKQEGEEEGVWTRATCICTEMYCLIKKRGWRGKKNTLLTFMQIYCYI